MHLSIVQSFFTRRKKKIPRKNLLAFIRSENAFLDLGWEGDPGWEGALTGYALPISIYGDCDAETQAFFYSVDEGTSEITRIVKSMTQILAWSEINLSPGYAFAAEGKGVVVYSVQPTGSDEAKIVKYFKLV